jgi:hypothetical protein
MNYKIMPTITVETVDRFWAKVDRSGGPEACWPWTAYQQPTGYGRFGIGRKVFSANRIAYKMATGNDPMQSLVCHRCDNPPCCNPTHLFLGNHTDNGRDAASKGLLSVPHKPSELLCGENHWSKRYPERVQTGDNHWTRRLKGRVKTCENSHKAKLTNSQVLEIRARAGHRNYAELAREFNVTKGNVWAIVNGRSFKELLK